jgi:chaperonin GroEL
VRTGVMILRRALEEPMRGIAENAGMDGSVIINEIRRHIDAGETNIGYDVMRGVYGDMFELGITDPVKVTRSAVENATSIAAMILTTGALISDKPEENSGMPSMPGGMGGMDY